MCTQNGVLPNAESTSEFPTEFSTCAIRYAHWGHSALSGRACTLTLSELSRREGHNFYSRTFQLFFGNIIKLCLRIMIPREPGTWLSPGMVSISVLSEEIEHFKL